jgi:hypothetical protein
MRTGADSRPGRVVSLVAVAAATAAISAGCADTLRSGSAADPNRPANQPPPSETARPVGPSGSRSWSFAGAGAIEPSSGVFLQAPSMGVACHIPNWIACDRVGLTVWLARRATVTATIAGAHVRLNDPHWSYVVHDHDRTQHVYTGFLQPAGLTARLHIEPNPHTLKWFGSNAPSPVVPGGLWHCTWITSSPLALATDAASAARSSSPSQSAPAVNGPLS